MPRGVRTPDPLIDKILEVEQLIKGKASDKDFDKYFAKLEEVYNGLSVIKECQEEYENKIKQAKKDFDQKIKDAKSKKSTKKSKEKEDKEKIIKSLEFQIENTNDEVIKEQLRKQLQDYI